MPLLEDATHHQIAQHFVLDKQLQAKAEPVSVDGQLWLPDDRGLWQPISRDRLMVEYGGRYTKLKRCVNAGDYRRLADYTLALQDRQAFFDDAPRGVVCPGGFWRLLSDGRLHRDELHKDHRQRFALAFDPDFDTEPVLFDRYLATAFAGDHFEEQIALASEAIGAGLFGLASNFMTVVLLLGPGGSGKSTFLAIVQHLFSALFVAAVSPMRWDHEYFVAGLAGKRLNVVGELPEDRPLPAAAFKNVTGGDLVEARHPTHRPFHFRCEALHLFNSNSLPSLTDRSDAMFRRWRVLRFARSVPAEQRDPNLADKIIDAELGAVLAWAMQGAERAAARGRLSTTKAHDEVMARWRIASNPVLRFFTDPEHCSLDPDGPGELAPVVYAAYRAWAVENGNKPMSSQAFWDVVDNTAGGSGIHRTRRSDGYRAMGIRLKRQPRLWGAE